MMHEAIRAGAVESQLCITLQMQSSTQHARLQCKEEEWFDSSVREWTLSDGTESEVERGTSSAVCLSQTKSRYSEIESPLLPKRVCKQKLSYT